MTGPVLGAATQPGAAPGAGSAAGGAVASAPGIAASGRNALRLQGVVVAAGQGGPIVELGGGRLVLLEGAPALRPLARVEVQVPSGRLPEGEAVDARLVPPDAGGGQGSGGEVLVRLRPAPATPALLPARPGPALPGTLAHADGSGDGVEVRLAVMPSGAAAESRAPPSTAAQPTSLAAILGALAGGVPVAALVLPRRQGERAGLDVGAGLVVRLGVGTAGDLAEGGTVLVRLVGIPGQDGTDTAAGLRRALAEGGLAAGRSPAGVADPLPADARLGARLRALADGLERDVRADGYGRNEPTTGDAAALAAARAVLGDPGRPATVRLARERGADGRPGGAGADEAGHHLVLDVTFARLGRFRLEVGRPGGGDRELRIALRGERPLPAEARAELLDRVGAAFELGGARARLVVSTGNIPPPPPARAMVA